MAASALAGRLVVVRTVVVVFACFHEPAHEGAHTFVIGDD